MSNQTEIKICLGSSCFARGNKMTVHKIKEYISENYLEEKVIFSGGRCFGKCEKGPILIVNGIEFEMVDTAEALTMIEDKLKSI